MNLNDFFKRIEFKGVAKPDLATLSALQERFLLSVPFENLDIHYGNVPVTLNLTTVYEKIVDNNRGGICYECSNLMAWALREIGYSVDFMSAQMMPTPISDKLNDRHIFLKVSIDGNEYAVDVGNGQSFRHPLNFNGNNEGSIPEGKSFRISRFNDEKYSHLGLHALYYVNDELNENGETRFIFRNEVRELQYFQNACDYAQSSPLSIFVKKPIASLALSDGRISISPKVLCSNKNGIITETSLNSEKEFIDCLKKHFNLVINKKRNSLFGSDEWQEPKGIW